jgi:hypothetical protein
LHKKGSHEIKRFGLFARSGIEVPVVNAKKPDVVLKGSHISDCIAIRSHPVSTRRSWIDDLIRAQGLPTSFVKAYVETVVVL